jgi:hypothetical protein
MTKQKKYAMMRKGVVDDIYLWIRKEPGKSKEPCPSSYHRASAYKKFYDDKRYCVRDCDEWKPARFSSRRGACGIAKSDWMTGLMKHWRANKHRQGYTYTDAMHEYKIEYRHLLGGGSESSGVSKKRKKASSSLSKAKPASKKHKKVLALEAAPASRKHKKDEEEEAPPKAHDKGDEASASEKKKKKKKKKK